MVYGQGGQGDNEREEISSDKERSGRPGEYM